MRFNKAMSITAEERMNYDAIEIKLVAVYVLVSLQYMYCRCRCRR